VSPRPAPATSDPAVAATPPEPEHIARLHLPPPAQSRGPVESLPAATIGADLPPQGDGIRRCAGPDGTAIFTDRRCEDMGAVASAAPSAGNASTRIFVRNCARSREALVDGLRDALEAQDANRVASYYHWTGMGNRAAYALMDRLQGFSERPLMDIRLVTSGERAIEAGDVPPLGWYPLVPPGPPPPPPPPDLVRVDQMRAYDDAAAQVTYLHLLANAGCWWVHF
jgi:hypothetical protein